jgi:hypothetical protein
MESMNDIIITHHPLNHIPELTVDPGLLHVRFAKGCSMLKCSAACCQYGVWADVAEKTAILRHVDLIRRYMEPDMEKNPEAWFDEEIVPDMDFVSGLTVGTAVRETGCVFLNSAGLCVLQKAEMGEGDPTLKLKPFYCKAFPVTLENGRVIYDDYMKSDQPQCCSAIAGGELTAFDFLHEELELVLGKEGTEELREKAREIYPDDIR